MLIVVRAVIIQIRITNILILQLLAIIRKAARVIREAATITMIITIGLLIIKLGRNAII